jgi:hypothetical protein
MYCELYEFKADNQQSSWGANYLVLIIDTTLEAFWWDSLVFFNTADQY